MKPILTTLSYSAGEQSHALLHMILWGHIECPKPFLVVNADPGMEDERTSSFVVRYAEECQKRGIDFVFASQYGPNLYEDLTTFRQRGLTHLNTPPYWTKNPKTGKRGRLKQKCTGFYKIAAMRRAIRLYMFQKFGVSMVSKRLPTIETWIGFAADEADRVKPVRKTDPKYIRNRYPLIEMGMTKAKVSGYYLKHGIVKPPRSVCAACYGNGLAYFEDMYINRPDDWDKAVKVDDAIRDMKQLGIKEECYVSSALIPLRDLPDKNFKHGEPDYKEHRCNSGVCFV